MRINRPSYALILQLATVVAVVVLFAAWWKQQSELSRMRQHYAQMEAQNKGLQRDLAQVRVASAAVPPQAPEAASAKDPLQDNAAIHPEPPPPVPERNHLALTGSEVSVVSNGLVTALQFQPKGEGALGMVALAFRLPRGVEGRILNVGPVGSAAYADDSVEVSENGKFAFFQGTLGAETNVQIALTVSGTTTVHMRGTCGIGALQIDISPSGAKVRSNQ